MFPTLDLLFNKQKANSITYNHPHLAQKLQNCDKFSTRKCKKVYDLNLNPNQVAGNELNNIFSGFYARKIKQQHILRIKFLQ
jgi:hypothetical protein